MDPTQEIKGLRAQNEAMKKEVSILRAEGDDARQENRAATLVIEYFKTHNPPKPSSDQCSSEPAGDFEQIPQRS